MQKIVKFAKLNLDSLYLIFGNAVSRVIIIVSTFIMIHLLGDILYSKYAVLYNGMLTLQVFSVFGLNTVATKYVATGESALIVFKKVFSLTFIITISLFIFLQLLLKLDLIESLRFLKDINLFILCFSTYSLVLFSCVVSILYGLLEKNKVATLNILNSIFLLFFLSIASLYKDLNILFLLFGVGNLTSSLLAIFFLSKKIFIKTEIVEMYGAKTYILNGFPIFLSALLVAPVLSVIYMLMNKNNFGSDIAVFSVALQWYSIILFVPGVLANLLLAKFAKTSGRLDSKQYIRQISVNFIIATFMSTIVYLILLFILPLYGSKYSNQLNIFLIFILTAIANSLNTVTGQMLLSVGKQWYGFIFNIVWAVVLLSSVSICINYDFGLKGVAYSFLIAYVFHAIYQNIYVIMYFKGIRNG